MPYQHFYWRRRSRKLKAFCRIWIIFNFLSFNIQTISYLCRVDVAQLQGGIAGQFPDSQSSAVPFFLDNIIIITKKRQYEVKSTLFIDGGGYGYTAVSSLGAGKTL
jgi:hypothetical protein